MLTIISNLFQILSTALSLGIIVVLLILLVLKEILRILNPPETELDMKALDNLILPLLFAFGLIMVVRIINL